MNLPKLSPHQLVNLSLAALLFLGIAVTSYTVYNFTGYGADAARRGSTPASIALNETDPHLGDMVTFTTSGGSGVNVVCYQGGGLKLVYAAYQPVGSAFQLGGTNSEWLTLGGEVDCDANLYGQNPRKGILARTYFHALGAR